MYKCIGDTELNSNNCNVGSKILPINEIVTIAIIFNDPL